jgi:hypothetical protein
MHIHITINGLTACTNMRQPFAGQHQTNEEVTALAALNAMARNGLTVVYEHHPLHQLARDVITPEQFGHAVSPEVRRAALAALGESA